jgi:DNA repair exonuclease SbcCD ATPase subunit
MTHNKIALLFILASVSLFADAAPLANPLVQLEQYVFTLRAQRDDFAKEVFKLKIKVAGLEDELIEYLEGEDSDDDLKDLDNFLGEVKLRVAEKNHATEMEVVKALHEEDKKFLDEYGSVMDNARMTAEAQVESYGTEVARLKAQVKDLKKDLAEANSIIDGFDEKMADLRAENRQLKNAPQPVVVVQQETSGLRRLLNKEKEEVKSLNEKLGYSALAVAQLRADKNALQRSVGDANRRAVDAENRADRRERAAGDHVRAADKRLADKDNQLRLRGIDPAENNALYNESLRAIRDKDAAIANCNSKLAVMKAQCKKEVSEKDEECNEKLLAAGIVGGILGVIGGAVIFAVVATR